jgi:hypothetical protein
METIETLLPADTSSADWSDGNGDRSSPREQWREILEGPSKVDATGGGDFVEDLLDADVEPAVVRKGAVFVARARFLRPEEEVVETFSELADEWERETLVVSSIPDALSHPAYFRVIGLGLPAVPLLLDRLRESHRYWFPALTAITGVNPAEGKDNVRDAVTAWVEWGIDSGYLPVD